MKRSIFTTIRIYLRRLSAVLCFAMAIANFFMACSVTRSCHPRYIYNTVTNETVTASVVTQFINTVSSPSSVPLEHVDYRQPIDYPTSAYRYMLVNGQKAVELYGRIHYRGSNTSRGRIVSIFPDRVILDNGDTISNSNLERLSHDFGTIRPASRNFAVNQ